MRGAASRLIAAAAIALWPLASTGVASAGPSWPDVADHQQAAAEPPGEPEGPAVEAELAASTVFQSGLVSIRLGSPLLLDAHWLGLDGTDAGVFGLAWEFRRGGLRVLPGLAWGVIEGGRPTPAALVRWRAGHGLKVVTQIVAPATEVHIGLSWESP